MREKLPVDKTTWRQNSSGTKRPRGQYSLVQNGLGAKINRNKKAGDKKVPGTKSLWGQIIRERNGWGQNDLRSKTAGDKMAPVAKK